MRTASEILSSFRRKGIQLSVHCGLLHCRDPDLALSPEEHEEFLNNKGAIAYELAGISGSCSPPTKQPGVLPATLQQQFALWYFGAWWMHLFSVRLIGHLDIGLLTQSFETTARRHDAMRSRLVVRDGAMTQEVLDVARPLEMVDLSGEASTVVTDDDIQNAAEGFVDRWLEAGDTAFKAKLFKISDQHHVLVVAWDHYFEDYTSVVIAFRDVWRLYRDFSTTESALALKPVVQNSEYAVWQSCYRDAWLRVNGSYWEEKLRGAVALSLPVDSGLPMTPRMRTLDMSFSEGLSASLLVFTDKIRTSMSLLLFSFFVITMSRWSGQRDVTIPFSFHGRCYPDHMETVGNLQSYLLLRIRLGDEDTLASLLRSVSREFFAGATHSDLGGVAGATPELLMSPAYFYYPNSPHNLLVPAVEEWNTENQTLAITPYELKWEPSALEGGLPTFWTPFRLCSWRAPEGIGGCIFYRTDKYSREAVQRFRRWLRLLAERVTDDGDALSVPLSELREHLGGDLSRSDRKFI